MTKASKKRDLIGVSFPGLIRNALSILVGKRRKWENVSSTRANLNVNPCDPQRCAKVAGGRSEAKTSGVERLIVHTPEGCQSKGFFLFAHPFGVHRLDHMCSGGLRFAPTTGYCLAALKAATSEARTSVRDENKYRSKRRPPNIMFRSVRR